MAAAGILIVESILTTTASDGVVNFAPMGVEWGEDTIVIKPFVETVTFRNLIATGVAVVNITDDVMLIARAAISSPQYAATPAERVEGAVLAAACSWRELRVRSLDTTPPRARVVADVVHRGTRRDFIGFNRARHAVLEAAILATRLHLVARDEIERELARLQVIVDKTAGPRELDAMALVVAHVRTTPGPSA